ncbi:hypothetical protein AVEN_233801-1 [Araneus ventricosus]|uniref:Uncharacterized protein n=1 Tax=Araneus ventricosus TaxID=182803 RepID=A0A4Y2Q1U7_ARAVE|nr:hypothetical protein AVEN_233801-1 [Araneus ventricosus]
MQSSALSEIGTISLCHEFPTGKFSSEKLLINISFSDQIYQNENLFSETDLNDMVSKILDQFPMNSMKGQAKNDEFMLLGPPSPTKHLHKISPIPRLSQVSAKHRIKDTAVLLTSTDNRNALKANLEK